MCITASLPHSPGSHFPRGQLTCILCNLLHLLPDSPAPFQLKKIPYALSFISSHTAFTNQLTTFENTRDSNLSAPSSAGVVSREEY